VLPPADFTIREDGVVRLNSELARRGGVPGTLKSDRCESMPGVVQISLC
jgi:hypothetical protein